MPHYYDYTLPELQKEAKIPLKVFNEVDQVFKWLAYEMINEIEENNALGKQTVFICPVGPVGHYEYFIEAVNQKRISLEKTWFINMDEYLLDDDEWIAIESPLSFRGYMNKHVYDKIDSELLMPSNQRIFPDPKNVSEIPHLIEQLGGVDMVIGGVGINGHLAFNEPEKQLSIPAFLALETRVLALDETTRTVNAMMALNGALELMPHRCITVGFKEIYQGRKIRLCCFRDWHQSVVKRGICGEQTTEFPVTLLQTHPDTCLGIPENLL